MRFTDIDEAVSWIMSRRNNNYSFSHFKEVCHKKGDPQDDLYMIHVAGTDGKGSTVSYLSALLRSQGYKVGTFTSPHYLVHQDRIRINGNNIPDEAFLRILNEGLDFFLQEDLSMFEMDYLIMCEYFREEKVDMAVVEVGLGGRLDSTNVVDRPALSVITTIGYDHMDRLGNTLEEICTEKCGIIKDDSKVLIGHLNDSCTQIAKDTAEKHHCEFYELGAYEDLGDRKFRFQDEVYEIASYAKYQLHNASLALQAFDIVSDDYPFIIDRNSAKKALKEAIWQCRFEIVREDPRVILDGAHNIHGISALVESFDTFTGSKCIIFSALKRKEYQKMIGILKDHCDRLIITGFHDPGAIDPGSFEGYETVKDYQDAIDLALKDYDNILICGSLYFLSEVVQNGRFS